MKDCIGELGIQQEEYWLYCDSQSFIHLANYAANHSRKKHMQRKYHKIQERIEDKDFTLLKVRTEENKLTKVLSVAKLEACKRRIRLTRHPMPE